jgi:hypothetical protein
MTNWNYVTRAGMQYPETAECVAYLKSVVSLSLNIPFIKHDKVDFYTWKLFEKWKDTVCPRYRYAT